MIQKTVSIFLSILMLLSSSGLAYASHYCGEYKMISKLTLGEEHLSCGMVVQTSGCEDDKNEPECCDNEYTQVETDDNFVEANFEFKASDIFITYIVSAFILQNTYAEEDIPDLFRDRSPPPLEKDFQVLLETYLI